MKGDATSNFDISIYERNPNIVYMETKFGSHFGFYEGPLQQAFSSKTCYTYPAKVATVFFETIREKQRIRNTSAVRQFKRSPLRRASSLTIRKLSRSPSEISSPSMQTPKRSMSDRSDSAFSSYSKVASNDFTPGMKEKDPITAAFSWMFTAIGITDNDSAQPNDSSTDREAQDDTSSFVSSSSFTFSSYM
jgi:hypothetical protein